MPDIIAPSPLTLAVPTGHPSEPIKNLRITFWGVQGSCPIFPTNREVTEYAKIVARDTVERVMRELADKAVNGHVETEYLRQFATAQAAARFQEQLGLPSLPVYGGETTCIEIETSDGHIIVLDAGSGLREFSSQLLRKWAHRQNRVLHIFGSHEHLDHRSGLPFAGFVFAKVEPFLVNVYGTHRFLQTLDGRYGIFSQKLSPAAHADDPLDYRMMAAKFHGVELRVKDPAAAIGPTMGLAAAGGPGMDDVPWEIRDLREPIRIGATTITPFEVCHVTDCLGYTIRHGDVRFVFCTDHEYRHGDDPTIAAQARSSAAEAGLVDHCWDADLGYFDGQYFRSEYEGLRGIGFGPPVSRIGWGHGCVEDCISRSRKCRIRRSLIGHHDPERQWDDRLHLDSELSRMTQGEECRIELAKQGMVVDL